MQIGRYELTRRIGKGALGVLFHARDVDTNGSATLKLLTPDNARNPDLVVRFLRGAEAAGSLLHPSIVTVYGFGEENGVPYIAMEHLDGVSLKRTLEAGTRLDPERMAAIAAEVADGLGYAHDVGVFHRNVKPANIWLMADGTVRLLGFDIAKISSSEGGISARFTGTPSYMSPEQIRGGRIDGRSDQFSLGVTLYQMLAGRKPFPAGDVQEVARQILEEPPLPLVELRGGPHAGLEPVVMRCLEKDPAKRFDTCHGLVEALRETERPLAP